MHNKSYNSVSSALNYGYVTLIRSELQQADKIFTEPGNANVSVKCLSELFLSLAVWIVGGARRYPVHVLIAYQLFFVCSFSVNDTGTEKKLDQSVAHLTFIREIPGLNLRRRTECSV